MRFVAGIRNEEERGEAERAFLAGRSPDTVRMNRKAGNRQEDDAKTQLVKEKQRIERTIDALSKRLGEVERELEGL
jgi:hypothetical protein